MNRKQLRATLPVFYFRKNFFKFIWFTVGGYGRTFFIIYRVMLQSVSIENTKAHFKCTNIDL